MALFTGKGDGGTTKAFDSPSGVRISKASELPEALGTLDELNSFLGFCKYKSEGEIKKILRDVQETLFIVQAETAGADKRVGEEKVREIEAIIYRVEKEIPPIKSFSIAGGTELSALLDVARTLARRAERRLVGVHEAKIRELSEFTRTYMNRLSSLLFALARLSNHQSGISEENPSYR
jgi:cob(I)alamin adenosyltransferase